VRRPSIQNIRERYSDHVPPGPNTWTLNIQLLGGFRPHYATQINATQLQVRETSAGYEVTFGITAGVSGPIQQETVPYPEVQPSPDGKKFLWISRSAARSRISI
jgi:hypothetical protein